MTLGGLALGPGDLTDRPVRAGLALGVDEAGRGSVLGPLVVGAFLFPTDRLDELVRAGARDSKLLSPKAREEVYDRIRSLGTCDSIAIPAPRVDRRVRRHELNDLEAEVFARLVHRHRPEVVYADSCDPVADRFGERIARLSGTATRVVARHHADRDLPIVGAASIVAKVRRDRAIARLQTIVEHPIGSGYPSDPETVEFVRAEVRARRPLPSYIRSSWKTTANLMRERSARRLESFDGDRGDARVARRSVQPPRHG